MELTLKQAEHILDAALAEARRAGAKPMGCVVLDAGGHLIAYKREDGASLLRFQIAMGKAWGAIAMLTDSRSFMDMAKERPAFVQALGTMTEGRIVPSAGGVLIKDAAGKVLGSIGLSGDLPDVDEACAKAGIAVL